MPVTLLRPYCTEAEVRAVCGNQDAGVADKIRTALNNASRFIEELLKRDFVLHDYTSGSPLVIRRVAVQPSIIGSEMFLPLSPIITLTSVTEDGDLLVESDDYVYDGPLGIIKRITASGCDANWGEEISLVVKLGYDNSADAEAPAATLIGPIRQACAMIAAAWSGENRREQIGFDGKKVPLTDKTIPKEAWDLLCPFIPSNV